MYISSSGGYVHSGQKIIQYMNYIKLTNHKIICIANMAFSMAFHIFQYCDLRLVHNFSKLMQHQLSLQISDSIENLNNYIEMINKLNTNLIQIESKRLKLSEDDYRKKISSDWWLYGNDIINKNCADFMIGGIGCEKELVVAKKILPNSDLKDLRLISKCPLIEEL